MKRSIDNVSGSSSGPQNKRQNNEENSEESEEIHPLQFILQNQNRGLSLELMDNKRTIVEARKELELMRRKAREMETLVSLVQRAWSQLDIDSALILDSLGDSEVIIPESGSTELLYRMLHIHDRYSRLDPTCTAHLPKPEIDQWTSNTDIEKSRDDVIRELEDAPRIKPESTSIEIAHHNEVDEEDPYASEIEEHLSQHVQFTLSLLERVCNTINESGHFQTNPEALKSLAQARESHAKIMFLNDNIAKLRNELVLLETRSQQSEAEKIRVQQKLDKALLTIQEMEENGSTRQKKVAAVTGENNADDTTNGEDSQEALIKELQQQIKLLEKQLTDSESAKAKVEMTLTERLSRPMPQTEAQVADMRKAMEELRSQCKLRVASLMAENDVMQDKVKDLSLALSQVEANALAKVEEVVSVTQKEIQKINTEKAALETKLCSLQSDSAMIEQIKKQLDDKERLDAIKSSELRQLQNQLKSLQDNYSQSQRSLEKARKREKFLEHTIMAHAIPVPAHIKLEGLGGTKKSDSVSEVGGDAPTSSSSTVDNGPTEDNLDGDGKITIEDETQQLLRQAQERAADLEKELSDMKTSVNDLILEIETVSSAETESRKEAERLLTQISDCQGFQRAALEENLKLQNQLEELKSSKKDMETKTDMIKALLAQQESLLIQSRQEEQSLKLELIAAQKIAHEAQESRHEDEQKRQELQQKLSEVDHRFQAALKRNQELQLRCDELSKQCEQERKLRLDEQRELSKLKRTKKDKVPSSSSSSSNAAKGSMGQDEMDMLDMALGMLRCSVCKDRFKSVAIKKCFHLFCKECIDENLRNRSRKCPACGEKFGQDDVTPIYFTN